MPDAADRPTPRAHRRRLAPVVALAVVALLVAACGDDTSGGDASGDAPSDEQAGPAQLLSPAEFGDLLSDEPGVPVVNVHVPYEGHIEGTTDFVPFTDIGGWDGLPDDKGALIALYCRSGNMSRTASETLADMGYTNLVDLEGGMVAWTAAGYPLIDDDPAGA